MESVSTLVSELLLFRGLDLLLIDKSLCVRNIIPLTLIDWTELRENNVIYFNLQVLSAKGWSPKGRRGKEKHSTL